LSTVRFASVSSMFNAVYADVFGIAAPADAIDVCGTGGDGAHTLNISTAVGFVVASLGVPVAKHGNRAASSLSGAADILAALGWQGDLPFDRLEACLGETGIVFLHAQRHHPAMARVAAVRRRLKARTIFNLLGPLANPAGVRRQMVGVFAPRWLHPMAEAAKRLGSTDVLAVHGGGLDEISVHAPADLLWMRGGSFHPARFDAARHGLGPHPLASLEGGQPEANADALRALFSGSTATDTLSAYRAIVVANAAAALKLAGAAPDWSQGIEKADASIASGAARDTLARFIAFR
jgi:anthranilate phosphoribosyltransferase